MATTITGEEFLAKLPALPDYAAYRAKWLTLKSFEDLIGEVLYKEKRYIDSSGGGSNDSLRGFGPTSHIWLIPTRYSWTICYSDNPGLMLSGKSPEGILWVLVEGFGKNYVRQLDLLDFELAEKTAIAAREEYLWRNWASKTAPKIPLKFEGYYIQNGWVYCEDIVDPRLVHKTNPNKHVGLYRILPDTDIVRSLHTDPMDIPDAAWWHKGMKIQDLF
jgi:hypothetical protein